MNISKLNVSLDNLALTDSNCSKKTTTDHKPLTFQPIVNDIAMMGENDNNIDKQELTANDYLLSNHPSFPTYDDNYITGLFDAFTEQDDQELIAVFKNSIKAINYFQGEIHQLQRNIEKLYNIIGKPQIIEIKNFNQLLKPTGAFSIEDQVTKLFFDACIPTSWKTNVKPNFNPSCNKIDSVSITMVNYCVKEKTKEQIGRAHV